MLRIGEDRGVNDATLWDGSTITSPGIYSGISLAAYHDRTDLLDAPSVSKSSIKHILPPHGGSPKAFWWRWAHNPNRIEPKESKALDFGKLAHCLLLGDEIFADRFAVTPEEAHDAKGYLKPWKASLTGAKEWLEWQREAGRTVVSPADIEMVRRMHKDAAEYDLVRGGILNGAIEQTMVWKDPETGIWIRARPDAIPTADGVYADLKTAGKFDEDFLQRQIFTAGYYLQAAMTRMICREVGLPFQTFVLLYCLKGETPDTTHVEIDAADIDLGEEAVRHGLRTLRACLDAGEWPGARPFSGGERAIGMKPWDRDRLSLFLRDADADAYSAAASMQTPDDAREDDEHEMEDA